MKLKRKESETEDVYPSNKKIKTSSNNKTRCKFCPRYFVDRGNYVKHFKKHHETPIKCTLCPYSTHYKVNFSKHMISHGIIQKWSKCRYCDREFKRPSARYYHEVSHTGVSCKLCNEKFYSPYSILSHLGAKHPEENKFHCDVCDKSFPNITMRNTHMKITACRAVNRNIPGKDGTDNSEPQRNKINSRKDCLFSCDLCCKGFNKENSLLVHKIMRSCRNSKEKNLQFSWTKHFNTDCILCGQTIINKLQLKKHLIGKHRDSFNSRKSLFAQDCNFCGKIVKDYVGRFMHVIRHLGFVPLKCHICDFRTSWTVSMKKHLVNIHGSDYYICHLCNNSCKNSSDYKEHLHKEHNIVVEQVFNYICDICGNGFFYNKTFRSHQKKCATHSCEITEKAIVQLNCVHCQKTFENESDCNLHLENQECIICGFIFENCLDLQKHKILFALDRLCSFCSYIASHGSFLSCHMKEVHPSCCVECDICCKKFSNSITYNRHLKSHRSVNRNKSYLKKSKYYRPTCDSEEEDLFSIDRLSADNSKYSEVKNTFECGICGKLFANAAESLDHERLHKFSCNLADENEFSSKYFTFNELYANFVMQKVNEINIVVSNVSGPLSKHEFAVKEPCIIIPGSIIISSETDHINNIQSYAFEERLQYSNNFGQNNNVSAFYEKNMYSSKINNDINKQSNQNSVNIRQEHVANQIFPMNDIKFVKILKTPIVAHVSPKFITSSSTSMDLTKINRLQYTGKPTFTIPSQNNLQYIISQSTSNAVVESKLSIMDSNREERIKKPFKVKHSNLFAEVKHSRSLHDSNITFFQNVHVKTNKGNSCQDVNFNVNPLNRANIDLTKSTDVILGESLHEHNYAVRNQDNFEPNKLISKNIVRKCLSKLPVSFNDMIPINLSSISAKSAKKLKFVGTINLPENISIESKRKVSQDSTSSCNRENEFIFIENSLGNRVMRRKTVVVDGKKRVILEDCGMAKKLC